MQTLRDRRWVVALALGVMLVTSLPYALGFVWQTEGWQYSGLLMASEDGFSYLAKMLLGAQGDWLFRTPYTLAPQSGFIAYLPYLLLGKLTAPPGQYEQMVVLFHLFRFAGGILVALASYDFLGLFLKDEKLKRFCLLVILAGGGLAFLAPFGTGGWWQGPMPLEYYSPETFGFLGLFSIPHLSWARACLLWGLISYIRSIESGSLRSAAKTGLLWLAAGLFQPMTTAIGWALLAAFLGLALVWWLASRRNQQVLKFPGSWWYWLRNAGMAALISSPLVLYNVISFGVDPFLRAWQAQNILKSPPPVDYLLGFFLVLPAAILGLVRSLRSLTPASLLLVSWVSAFPLLAYAPVEVQRRLPDGIWVVLATLAGIGLLGQSRQVRLISSAWIALGFLPAIFLWMGSLISLQQQGMPLYRPAGEREVFQFLAESAPPSSAVLASYDTSTALPAFAPMRVPIGHGPESLGLTEIRPEVEDFFRGAGSLDERLALLETLGIDYVIWGPLEDELGTDFLSKAPEATLIFDRAGYRIYSLQHEVTP